MKYKILLISITLFIISSLIFAQEEFNYIVNISVEGNINVTSSLIKSASGLASGDIYSQENIAEAIRNIYQLKLFEDIKINKIVTDKGIKLVIWVKESPIIEEVVVTGNKKIKTKDIKNELSIKKGDYWSGRKTFKSRRKILSLYRDKGYRLADIEFKEDMLANNRIELMILIHEGLKTKIEDILFAGNKNISSKKLKSIMKTKPHGFLRSGKFELEKFENDLQVIADFYHSKGYIDAYVKSWDSKYDKKGNLFLSIDIYEGEQYKLGTVQIEGNTLFSDNIIKDKLNIQKDEIFDQDEFNQKLNTIRSMYYEEGYIYSTLKQDIKTNNNTIDLSINISENNRAKVRKIIIKGNKKTREKIIRRKLAIVPGDYFRQSLLIQSQRNIYNTGFFEPNIGIDYQPINDKGDIDIIISVEDQQSGTANMGVTYDEVDKLVGFLAFTHQNLLGKSWGLKLEWQFSGLKQNYDVSFTNPYFMDNDLLVGFDLYHTSRDWSDWNYKVKRFGGGIRIGTLIPWINYAKFIAGYSLTQKKYDLLDSSDENTSDEVLDLVVEGKRITSIASITLERDGRDNIFRPSQGSLIRSYTELSGGLLGGNVHYYKEIIQTNWYLPLIWKISLGSKWRIGYVNSFGDTKDVPPDERFYPGGTGADGIRGYSDRSVIPPGSDGGNAELITSTELTFPISGDQIIGVIFLDAGNSYNYFSEININKLKKGAGIGVRIMSPMGLLGFDYAYGFDRKTDNKWQFHFQFGTTF